MDFLLLTRAAGVLPAPPILLSQQDAKRQSSCTAAGRRDCLFCFGVFFFFFPFRKLLSLSSSVTAFSDTVC